VVAPKRALKTLPPNGETNGKKRTRAQTRAHEAQARAAALDEKASEVFE
jgi:hypothetical protein